MTAEELKKITGYSFECYINPQDVNTQQHDEWGCAFCWLDNELNIGVEYNLSYDKGECSSGIYKSGIGEDGYLNTDYSDCESYEIDFSDSNWMDKLEEAMCEAVIQYFSELIRG